MNVTNETVFCVYTNVLYRILLMKVVISYPAPHSAYCVKTLRIQVMRELKQLYESTMDIHRLNYTVL